MRRALVSIWAWIALQWRFLVLHDAPNELPRARSFLPHEHLCAGLTIDEMARQAHTTSRAKGWYDGEDAKRNIPEMLALIHSEVSEGLECYRNDEPLVWFNAKKNGKPEGLAVELADALIRIGDMVQYLGVNDFGAVVEVKMQYNLTRPHRHGGKRA